MKTEEAFTALSDVITALLSPTGCPWDRKQTPESLCDYVVEEAFELVEAIRSGDVAGAREEIGDVMFLLLFVAELYERAGAFSLKDSLEESAAKMIRRHPHVFANGTISCQDDLLRTWERIKRAEKSDEEGRPAGVFDSLPRGLPPLLKAYRIHSKTARAGFTWASDEAARAQFAAEMRELDEAVASDDAERIEAEYGDALFTFVELGRRLGVKANAALDKTNARFLTRFARMESLARERGKDVAELDMAALDALWDEAKAEERRGLKTGRDAS